MQSDAIKIFVDSADRTVAERWLVAGVATGLTTNPTILRRANAHLSDIHKIAEWAQGAGAREVCFQTWGGSSEEWYENAERLLEVVPWATIKVPCTESGARVAARLQAQGVPILLTAGYAAKQMLVASALRVRYFAPYFNRMNIHGRDALAEFATMVQIVPQTGDATRVMAASVKSAADVLLLAKVGVRTFTLAPEVLTDLLSDDLTDHAVGEFESDMRTVL